MNHLSWPGIEGAHHIRKYITTDPSGWWRDVVSLQGQTVVYRAKVKLHGTNAAVQIYPDDYDTGNDPKIVCQSRTDLLTKHSTLFGFYNWATEAFAKFQKSWQGPPMIIYGEWFGPGILRKAAATQVPQKSFAVFAARPIGENDILIVDPEELSQIVQNIPNAYVLPWYSRPCHHGCDTVKNVTVEIDWKASSEELIEKIQPINDWVKDIEANDPWIEQTFNIQGTGEGLVFYPVSHTGFSRFEALAFKSKGEKHKTIGKALPAQIDPAVANSIDDFVKMVLTEARLEQGVENIGLDTRTTLGFITWCTDDVAKECQDELEASDLTWEQVVKPLTSFARKWYTEQVKVRF